MRVTIQAARRFLVTRWRVALLAGAVLVGLAALASVHLARPEADVPTAVVKRGEFVEHLQLRGEVKALKSVTVNAPFDAGDLQIVKLVPTGARVKKGDVLVRFDVTKLEQELAQSRSALRSAQAEIEQARAHARINEEQDLTDLMKARYELEVAKLEAGKQEIVSRIEGEEAKLKVADSEQKLREAEAKLKANRAAARSEIGSKEQKRDKASFEVRRAERQIALLTLRSPLDGTATLLMNWRAGGPFGAAREFKEGDRAWPGAAIVDLPDLAALRVHARVDETDRGRVRSGQAVLVRVDAVPDRDFAGRLVKISPLATADFSAGWPFPRNFRVEIELEQADPRLRPGMSAIARLVVDRLRDALLVPTKAVFQRAGHSVAYVQRRFKFEERAIEVARRSEDQLVVARGLSPGDRVALKDLAVQE